MLDHNETTGGEFDWDTFLARMWHQLVSTARCELKSHGLGTTEAEDLAQDASQIAFVRKDQLRDWRCRESWVQSIVRNRARDHVRKMQCERRKVRDCALSAIAEGAPMPLDIEDMRFVCTLSPMDKLVLDLLGRGLSRMEIAVHLEVSASVVRARIRRIRKRWKGES